VTATNTASSTPLERDARLVNAHEHRVAPGEIAIGVIIGRTSEFFDFFVYAIASVLVFPSLLFPTVDAATGTLYSFALFPLAFIARPIGSLIFMALDRKHGRGAKLTVALFLLGGSTMAMAFLPSFQQVGWAAATLLALFRVGQGIALGGVWDGLPSLLSLNAPANRRGWFAMVPQLGAPIGLLLATGLFIFFLSTLSPDDFLGWGWRYPFFVAFAINVVALFARLRLVATPDFERLFESRELQPAPVMATLRAQGRTVILGAFAPLVSFAMFHLVTVFPLSWVVLHDEQAVGDFLAMEIVGALLAAAAMPLSGLLADRIGRRNTLGSVAALIAAFSIVTPWLLDGGTLGQDAFILIGFVLLGLSYGQAAGSVSSNFLPRLRYLGAALTTDLSWLIGAAFAPLVALGLSARFGLVAVSLYLLSGACCTLLALRLSRLVAQRD